MNKINTKRFNLTFKIILTTLKNKLTKTRRTTLMITVNTRLLRKTECYKKNMTSSLRKLKINQNWWKHNWKKKKQELKQLNPKWRINSNLKLSCIKKTVPKRRRKKRNWLKLCKTINLGLMSLIKVWSNQKKLC